MGLGKLFGTDGIRGNIKEHPLLPENIALLARILGGLTRDTNLNPLIIIAKDTRSSGHYLEHALASGLSSMGVACELVGVMPTAALAKATVQTQASFGLMISASHNPSCDNGIKIFNTHGFKIDESLEQKIESLYFSGCTNEISSKPGAIMKREGLSNCYVEELLKIKTDLSNIRLVIDCAQGASYKVAHRIFQNEKSTIKFLGIDPNGNNINEDSGSEAPHKIKTAVIDFQAQLGIAFDGDADRVIFVDEKGQLIDGDAILATIAIYLNKNNLLSKNTLVSTIMSSVALDKALAPHGIKVERTQVGDKYVAKTMLDKGFSFGGENSGHLIVFPYSTTGDGLLSALLFLKILKESNSSASELVSFYKPSPRVLKNIAVKQKIPLSLLTKTNEALVNINQQLKEQGRVLLRYSGTENKARLLIEASSYDECLSLAEQLSEQFNNEIKEFLSTNFG